MEQRLAAALESMLLLVAARNSVAGKPARIIKTPSVTETGSKMSRRRKSGFFIPVVYRQVSPPSFLFFFFLPGQDR